MEVSCGHYFRIIILERLKKTIIFSLRYGTKETFPVVSLFQEKLRKYVQYTVNFLCRFFRDNFFQKRMFFQLKTLYASKIKFKKSKHLFPCKE